MLSKNGHHSHCAFADEIVSYLYDESSVSEKTAFAAHLENCANCSQELMDFGFVRSSIREWKNEEVSAFEMPALEIAISHSEKARSQPAVLAESDSWLDNLRRIFSASPKLAFGSAVFAVLAVCAVSALIVFNFSSEATIAGEGNQKPEDELAANTNTKKEEFISAPLPEKNIIEPADSSEKPERALNSSPREKTKRSENPNISPKIKPVMPKTNNTFADRNSKNKKNKPKDVRRDDAPTLYNPGEIEDESLRLADLFEEIGTE